MNVEQMLEMARSRYAKPSKQALQGHRKAFPEPPVEKMTPEKWVDRLVVTALQQSPLLLHPFAVRMAQGKWTKAQIREWARQEYQRTLYVIRHHALLAANASQYELLWGLLNRVKAEADSDPVGGTFFALPQLWLKFGISLGLTRSKIVGSQPHPLLALFNDAGLSEVRFSAAFPVRDLVDAVFEPVIAQIWGEALKKSLRLPQDALDYFRAVGADRWGEEVGRSLLQGWASSREQQVQLWNQYRAEVANDREWQRFTVLQQILESVKGS